MTTLRRTLIVNADDFGLSPGVNRGIIEAHEHGIVTSASLMVRWPAAQEAAAYAREHPTLSVGLHVDLGEWIYRDESWNHLYEVVRLDDRAAVAEEVTRQLARFRQLVGRDPTHLDSHQHIHREEPLLSVLGESARLLGVPLRHGLPGIHYIGTFYGQTGKGAPVPEATTVEALVGLLEALPPGVSELGCHPGYDDDLETMYRAERAAEVRVLCDERVRTAIVRGAIRLSSFGEIEGAESAS